MSSSRNIQIMLLSPFQVSKLVLLVEKFLSRTGFARRYFCPLTQIRAKAFIVIFLPDDL